MKRLILVRAGTTAWAKDNRIQGVVPLPLSEEGVSELQGLAQALCGYEPEILYSSGNESAGPTAHLLTELCRLKHKKVHELHELNCGLWQGLRVDEVKKRYNKAFKQWRHNPQTISPPQGESIPEARERVMQAFQAIMKKTKGKTVMLVAAPFVSAILECSITDTPCDHIWEKVERPLTKIFEFDADESLDRPACQITEMDLLNVAASSL